MGLHGELQQAMDVLGEWQHYGRTRNQHFEALSRECTAKDEQIEHLKHQVWGGGAGTRGQRPAS